MVNKYSAVKTIIDGIKFDSKMEAAYYVLMKDQVADRQIRVYMTKAKILMKPDFLMKNGEYHEVKGCETATYRLKRRLWKYYGLGTLVIIKKKGRNFYEAERIETKT